MIITLVLEDEKPLARNICSSIQTINENFVVKYVAHSGKQAIELLQEHKIDVAFIDINVPIVSGIEVAKYIKDNKPQTQFVILSGYQEFEYAQKALRYGAVDYLLKPLDKQQLKKTLEKIYKIKYKSDIDSYIKTPESKTDTSDKCYFGFYCIGSCADEFNEIEQAQEVKTKKQEFNLLLNKCFANSDLFISDGKEINEAFVFISNIKTSPVKAMQNLFEMSKFSMPVTMFFCDETVPLSQTRSIFYKNKAKFLQSVYLQKSSLIVGERNLKTKADLAPILSEIEIISKTQDKFKIEEFLHKMLNTQDTAKEELLFLSKSFFLKLCENISSNVQYLELEGEISYAINSAHTIADLNNALVQILNTYFYWYINKGDNTAEIAQKLKQFLDSNYSRDIKNSEIEKKMGYTNFYIRKVFKDTFGMLPSAYLNNLRIEKAKQLLAVQVQVKDVSASVGYQDPLYFSKVFKKAVGLSPTQYAKVNKD